MIGVFNEGSHLHVVVDDSHEAWHMAGQGYTHYDKEGRQVTRVRTTQDQQILQLHVLEQPLQYSVISARQTANIDEQKYSPSIYVIVKNKCLFPFLQSQLRLKKRIFVFSSTMDI